MERNSGLNAQGPRALVSKTTVMVREASTWVFLTLPRKVRSTSPVASTLMPVNSQMARYKGTKA